MLKRLGLGAASAGLLSTAGIMFTSTAVAVEPANFQLGPVFVAPTLNTKLGYTDNLLRSSDDELDTLFSQITPRVQAWLQNGVNTYSLAYKLEDYRYADSGRDDFTDQQVNLDLHHEFNARNTLNVIGEFYDGHEERGVGVSDGVGSILDKPVEYERATFGGDYTYGSVASDGRIVLEGKRADYQYQNFRDFTRFRDRVQGNLAGAFYWRVGAKTDALLELRYIDNEYDENNILDPLGSLDSDEYNYLVGLSWDASAKVSGSAKVGAYEREYNSSGREDDSGFQWEVDLNYQPRTYSNININTRRYSQETNGRGNVINTEEYGLSWAYNWNSRSATLLGVTAATENYDGTPREDDRVDVQASYNYTARRWLDLGIGLRHEDRDSNENLFQYTRNVFFIEAKLSL